MRCRETITVRTLGDVQRAGWAMFANCCGPFCGGGRPVDTQRLIDELGEDYFIIGDEAVAKRLRCEVCAYLGGRFTYRPASKRQ